MGKSSELTTALDGEQFDVSPKGVEMNDSGNVSKFKSPFPSLLTIFGSCFNSFNTFPL
ncbi:hypothetical protein PGB90_001647 [Kerria lacca]